MSKKNTFQTHVDNYYKSGIALKLFTNARKLFLTILIYSSENGFPENVRILDYNLNSTKLSQLELEEAREELITVHLAREDMEA